MNWNNIKTQLNKLTINEMKPLNETDYSTFETNDFEFSIKSDKDINWSSLEIKVGHNVVVITGGYDCKTLQEHINSIIEQVEFIRE